MARYPPGIQGARSKDPEGRDSQAPTLGLSHLLRACHVQMWVSEADSDCGCCLDRWAQCGLLGVSGPTPSGRSGSPVPALRAPGSGTPDAEVLLALPILAHHPTLTGSHPPCKDHQQAQLRAAQALGLVIKGTYRLDSLAGCKGSSFTSASPPVPGSLLVLYPSPRPTLLVTTLLLCLHEVNLFFGVCMDHTVFISSCLADVT